MQKVLQYNYLVVLLCLLSIGSELNSHITLKPFYFVRHGETPWNEKKWIQGQKDISLNEVGEQQARTIKATIEGLPIAHVFYSPLKRAAQTTNIACANLMCPKVALEALKECYLGAIEGTAEGNLLARMKQPDYDGEPLKTFVARVTQGINHILSHDGIPLIVAHGGTYDVLSLMYGMTLKEGSPANCAVLLFMPPAGEQKEWSVSQVSIE